MPETEKRLIVNADDLGGSPLRIEAGEPRGRSPRLIARGLEGELEHTTTAAGGQHMDFT